MKNVTMLLLVVLFFSPFFMIGNAQAMSLHSWDTDVFLSKSTYDCERWLRNDDSFLDAHDTHAFIWPSHEQHRHDYETATPVPEPAMIILFGTCLVGLAFSSRKKFKL